MATTLIQPSMAGGEVSLPVGARVDLAKRAVAVEKAENFVAAISGSMDLRGGQEYVTRDKNATRLIPFEFNKDQTFVLEFGDQYVRVITDGAQVLDSSTADTIEGATQANPVVITATGHAFSNGDEIHISGVVGMTELNGRNFKVASSTTNTFALTDLDSNNVDGTGYTAWSSAGTVTTVFEVATPYLEADLFDVRYAQSADVMTLTHNDYEERELIRVADDNWTLSVIDLYPEQAGPTALAGEVTTVVDSNAITAITKANPAVVTSGTHGYATGDEVLITGVVGMIEVNNFVFEVNVLTADTYELISIEDGTDIDSTGYTTYTSGGSGEKVVRMRKYAVTALNDETGEESLRCPAAAGLTVTNVTKASPAVVTVSDGHGLRTFDEIYISGVVGMTELNGTRFIVTPLTPTTFELQWPNGDDVDSTGYTTYSSAGTAASLFIRLPSSASTEWDNKLSWSPAAGAGLYNVYASTGGDYGYVGSTDKLQFIDDHIGPDTAFTPPRSRDPFRDDGTGNRYPLAVGFHEQRRVFANTNEKPNRFFMTQIGNLYNFAGSYPTQDDDPIIASLASLKINSIEHVLPLTDLVLLTSGGEFRVFSQAGALTPSTIQIRPQSYYGSTKLRPILAGEVGMFMSHGEVVRDFSYQFADDKFVGKDLTVLARHLFRGHTIVDWGFASSPYSVAWAVRDDGKLLSLTYMPEQDVYAWATHTTRGTYKSVAIVREGAYDVPYFLVERKVNGVTMQFIERQKDREYTDLHDAFCVDAGLTYESPSITITGITAANPVVVTATAHGLSNGDIVDLSGVMEEDLLETTQEALSSDYNGVGFTVANKTANTFELQFNGANYDGSGFAAYSSSGVAREAVTTVEGLWHLEGATVVAAANGKEVTGLTVANGAVTLTDAASKVHLGYSYIGRLITLPLSSYEDGSTIQSRRKNISKLTIELERSMGMWTGPSTDQMREATFKAPVGPAAVAAFSDMVDVTLKADWSKRKQIVIEQRAPLPLSVLSLIPDANIGG